MKDLDELISAAKRAVGARTNTEFGVRLGVSRQTVSNWKRHENTPDEKTVAEMARIVGIDAGEALILLQIAKAKTEGERRFWKNFLTTAASVLIAIVLIVQVNQPESAASTITDKLYIMRKWLKRLLALKPRQRHPLTITWT